MVLLVLAVVASGPVAPNATAHHAGRGLGTDHDLDAGPAYHPIPVDRLALGGVAVTSGSASGKDAPLGDLKFRVSTGGKTIAFDGVYHRLNSGDLVEVRGFLGRWSYAMSAGAA